MAGEYKGKTIFRHRYIGMNEEDIRQEIDRLQEEVYQLEEMLEFYRKDNVDIRNQLSQSQHTNEKLLHSLEVKLQNLQDSLDYTRPLKSQLDNIVKGFEVNLEGIYNNEGLKKQYRNLSRLTTLMVVNLLLLLGIFGLIAYYLFI